MYQFAYSAIVEEPPSLSHLSHCAKISKAIELYDAVSCDELAGHVRLQLLSDFRVLWLSIANGMPGQEKPETTVATALDAILTDIEERRFDAVANNAPGCRRPFP